MSRLPLSILDAHFQLLLHPICANRVIPALSFSFSLLVSSYAKKILTAVRLSMSSLPLLTLYLTFTGLLPCFFFVLSQQFFALRFLPFFHCLSLCCYPCLLFLDCVLLLASDLLLLECLLTPFLFCCCLIAPLPLLLCHFLVLLYRNNSIAGCHPLPV